MSVRNGRFVLQMRISKPWQTSANRSQIQLRFALSGTSTSILIALAARTGFSAMPWLMNWTEVQTLVDRRLRVLKCALRSTSFTTWWISPATHGSNAKLYSSTWTSRPTLVLRRLLVSKSVTQKIPSLTQTLSNVSSGLFAAMMKSSNVIKTHAKQNHPVKYATSSTRSSMLSLGSVKNGRHASKIYFWTKIATSALTMRHFKRFAICKIGSSMWV